MASGTLSSSWGGVLLGSMSSSAAAISATFMISVPVNAGDITKSIGTVVDVPAAKEAIGLLSVALEPFSVQSVSVSIRPAGTKSANSTLNA